MNQNNFFENNLEYVDLQQTAAFLDTILDNIPDPICIKDVEDRIVKCNRAALSFWNQTNERIIGRRCTELQLCTELCKQSITRKAYKSQKSVKERKYLKHKNKWIDVMVYPVLDQNTNKVKFFIEHLKDITELKNSIDQQDKLLEEVNRENRLKTEFFANISHELKTPLNVILSTLQLLENYYLPSGKTTKYTKMMKQNCYRLLRLLNNIIDMTKIESGYLKMHLENHDIVNIIKQITLSVDEYMKQKSIHLFFESEMKQKTMACDIEKLERIMLNLLSNAAKFTPAGGEIRVRVFQKDQYLIISVKDTGIGIPSEKQKLIFERYGQVDSVSTRQNEGSGIGLSLVKSLVEMHEGTIRFLSETQKGTEFIIQLPIVVFDQAINIPIKNELNQLKKIETIHIEFSDIYS